jgi:hypothetical protein
MKLVFLQTDIGSRDFLEQISWSLLQRTGECSRARHNLLPYKSKPSNDVVLPGIYVYPKDTPHDLEILAILVTNGLRILAISCRSLAGREKQVKRCWSDSGPQETVR